MIEPIELLPDLWLFPDTCNVYVSKRGDEAIAIDFGSGEWLSALDGLGIKKLEHVFLTHHHADQCQGLLARDQWPFVIHAPVGDQAFLSPDSVAELNKYPIWGQAFPLSYSVLPRGIADVRYDMAGFADMLWGSSVIRFLHTPGHGPNACSIILDHRGKQVVFCGDAGHVGATIHEPYNLEWDHWQGTGALAAWEGIQRLGGIGIDLLCPSHGPVVTERPRQMLRELSRKLMRFYRAKGQISPGEKDRYYSVEPMPCGARKLLPNLYQFGMNSYLLASSLGECIVVDPYLPDMQTNLEAVLAELGVRPTVALVSHYHSDHSNGIPYLREKYGVKAWLHPTVAEPLADPANTRMPYLPNEPITADHLWPDRGVWEWNEYTFDVAHWPGQTWAHCVFMGEIDGVKVVFGGDSFQPSSRWNGTGGFCAFNRSRFSDGYIPSCELILQWNPDIIAAGHQAVYYYSPSKFRKIIKWAGFAEEAVRALCPSGDLERDYYSVR